MPERPGKAHLLIRYPRIRGYALKAHELSRLIDARYDADISLEEHGESHLTLILDGREIYAETAPEQALIDVGKCIEAIRRHGIAERKDPASLPASLSGPERENDNDPDHRRWLNSVCSGE